MNDIEAAARAEFERWVLTTANVDQIASPAVRYGQSDLARRADGSYRYDYIADRWEAWRAALARAARGEGHSFTCPFGNAKKRGESPRDACNCGHFEKTHPTPPPATGEAGRRSASIDALRRIARAAKPLAFYARSLTGVPGEYLMRVPKDEADEIQRAVDAIWGTDDYATPPTPPPATGEAKWPEIRDSGGRTDFALTPATGEAGTREAEIRADERERCAKWHDERAETSGNERASWWHKDCAAAIRALPEAREGGGK